MGNEHVGRHANNYNLIRLVAAFAVLVSHSWPLTGSAWEPGEGTPLHTLGAHALAIFFAISGYFITASFVRRRSLVDFLTARVLRIVPGLVVVGLVTILIIAPLIVADYAAWLGRTGTATYPARIAVLMQPPVLPGLFERNPVTAVNGSLWSLPWEVGCYLIVVVTGLIGLLRRRIFRFLVPLAIVAVVALSVVRPAYIGFQSLALLLPFAIGMAMYLLRQDVPVSVIGVVALVALTWALRNTELYRPLYLTAMSYSTFWLGELQVPALLGFNRFGDISYGTYIYAWPIQQTAIAYDPDIAPIPLIFVAGALTLAAGALSWRLVEHPALVHRHRVGTWLSKVLSGSRKAGAA